MWRHLSKQVRILAAAFWTSWRRDSALWVRQQKIVTPCTGCDSSISVLSCLGFTFHRQWLRLQKEQCGESIVHLCELRAECQVKCVCAVVAAERCTAVWSSIWTSFGLLTISSITHYLWLCSRVSWSCHLFSWVKWSVPATPGHQYDFFHVLLCLPSAEPSSSSSTKLRSESGVIQTLQLKVKSADVLEGRRGSTNTCELLPGSTYNFVCKVRGTRCQDGRHEWNNVALLG